MAYTIVISDSGGALAAFQVEGKLNRSFAYEYNERLVPPEISAELETWEITGVTYAGAQADVTTTFATVAAFLGDRLTPVISVQFKRDGSTVFEMTTTTHKGGLLVRSLGSKGGDGQWASHWQADLVFVGRKLYNDGSGSGIAKLEKELSYTYDSSGLTTVSLTGRVTTIPGTSAEAKARELSLESPGGAFGLITQGPSDEPNVRVLDPESDTVATFESTWREHAITLPAGVNEFVLTHEIVQNQDGETVTTNVRAKGPTSSQLRSAVRAEKPTTHLTGAQEREDETGLEWSATYVQERPSTHTRERTGSEKIIMRRVEIQTEGISGADDRDDAVELIPGFAPWFTRTPKTPVRITERIVSRIRGPWTNLTDFNVVSVAKAIEGVRRQRSGSRGPDVVRESEGLTADADVWRAEAVYVYLAVDLDPERVAALVKEQ